MPNRRLIAPEWRLQKKLASRGRSISTATARTPISARTGRPYSIGQSVSSGCIRLMNQDIIDLYSRVPVEAKVVVMGQVQQRARGVGPRLYK